MKVFAITLSICIAAGIALSLFIRLRPVTVADVPALPGAEPPGDYELAGGYYAVRPVEAVDVRTLLHRISVTERTQRLSETQEKLPAVFVHRTEFFGFPDLTQVWAENGNLYVYGHLVYGYSDLDSNRERIQLWLSSSERR
ncbi:hypothetical protein FIV00_26060 [Labrenzia sp. THAF82]|uniref:DUF1499 domain-containing protein n=1 Tax=Labrenzia sp. THAF82 TaxID=2587861 RepID=UPI001267C24F|nr:DUF1499 domain-containing protein [Labrenzia sp. THAF82]QFT33988.1 hypothetical protein FIV00_26060 [Labrenzia sp. THAF82]